MSLARSVKASFNLDRMAAAAQRLGFNVERNALAIGYYTSSGMNNNQKFPLVIKGKSGRFDIGVTEEGLTTDYHGGYVQQDLNKILPAYYTEAATDAGFQVMGQNETAEELVITIGR